MCSQPLSLQVKLDNQLGIERQNVTDSLLRRISQFNKGTDTGIKSQNSVEGAVSQAEREAMALEEDIPRTAHLLSGSYSSPPLSVGIHFKTPVDA